MKLYTGHRKEFNGARHSMSLNEIIFFISLKTVGSIVYGGNMRFIKKIFIDNVGGYRKRFVNASTFLV